MAENYRNKLELRTFGMKRSGNHAIISWLTPHFESKVYFLNNVKAFSDPFHVYGDRRETINTVDIRPHVVSRDQLTAEVREAPKSCLLMSYEDVDLRRLQMETIVPEHDSTIGPSQRIINILIVRDHYNMMASRAQMWQNLKSSGRMHLWEEWKSFATVEGMRKDIELWLVYMREYLQITQFLSGETIRISFNRWFTDIEYRRSLSEQLGREFTDAGKNVLHPTGSSFDGRDFDQKASEMAVLERWQRMIEYPGFSECISDAEAVKISAEVFNVERPQLTS